MGDYYALESIFGGIAIISIILVVLIIVFAVFMVSATWRMYKKAGKGGWECIVPVYGYWVLAEIAGLEWWWFLLAIANSIFSILGMDSLAGIANLVSYFATFNIYYNIAKKFGKDKGNAILAAIFFGIFVFIFGFSKNEVYDVNIPVSKNGIFGTPEGNYNNNNKANYNEQSTGNVDMSNIYQNNSFCGNCGTKLENNVRFCPNCGKENI